MKFFDVQALLFCSFLALCASSCTPIKFTKPLCGPGSPGNLPEAAFPRQASGCYAVNLDVNAISIGPSIVAPLTKGATQYTWIGMLENRMAIGVPSKFKGQPYGAMCQISNSENERSFFTQSKDGGWWHFQHMSFGANWNEINISQVQIDLLKVTESNLPLARFAAPLFVKKSWWWRPDTAQPSLDSNLGITLIDNSAAPMEMLIDEFALKPNPVRMRFPRVKDELCANAGLKFFELVSKSQSMSWRPINQPF